jgi:hypothetical protein
VLAKTATIFCSVSKAQIRFAVVYGSIILFYFHRGDGCEAFRRMQNISGGEEGCTCVGGSDCGDCCDIFKATTVAILLY